MSEPALTQGEALHVLKHEDLFAVFDPRGDFRGATHAVGPSTGADGLFQDDTRILSRLVTRLCGATPVLLGASIGRDNVVFTANLTNPPLTDRSGREIAASQIHLQRRRLLWQRTLHEALLVQNYSATPISIDLTFEVDADFRDVFEIRGATRPRRGDMLPLRIDGRTLTLAYRGLDGETRHTCVSFSAPIEISGECIRLPIELQPGQARHVLFTVASDAEPRQSDRLRFFNTLKGAKRQARRHIGGLNRITSSNAQFDEWTARASADLALLMTDLETGPYPYAGIPWFSVPFGRDAVVTALQVLWIEPRIARGVLGFLSAAQAEEQSAFTDAAPGKIMHETRKGEMARLSEVPFARYYGGVDTTPLFVMLAGAYLERTGDLDFIRTIWPSIRSALEWMDGFGDLDGDGLIEYRRGADTGLQNQGWKDSHDSIFHSDGRLAEGPIALVEVQAYMVAAKRAAALIGNALGEPEAAIAFTRDAELGTAAIERQFWLDDLGTYALALDGDKRPCAVRSSNAGHVLFCGVASPERAKLVADGLMSPDCFSGWGIRTIGEGESRYNPMSYHNGTVWPHDCSLIAAGFARYGMTDHAGTILDGLFRTVTRLPDYRLPELFCGFQSRAGEGPVRYPSACTPQAWASGAVFLLLKAVLGLEMDATKATIEVSQASLPRWLQEVHLRDLAIAKATVSLSFRRGDDGVQAVISKLEGETQLVEHANQNRG